MRLVCPNCSAQYEVDASMIPDEGRDVQCSNCGTTWFELGEHKAAALAPEPEPTPEPTAEEVISARERSRPREMSREVFEADEDSDDTSWETQAPEAAKADDDQDENLSDAVEAIAAASSDDDQGEDDPQGESGDETKPVVARARRPADAAALDILKEEAERELSRRRAPASETLETQTDMALDEVRGTADCIACPARAYGLSGRRATGRAPDRRAESPAKEEEDEYETAAPRSSA